MEPDGIEHGKNGMRKILFLLCTLTIVSAQAQDIIVLNDATEIESKVLEISEKSVSYKKWNNQDGPTYTISADKIFFIKFANGEKEVFNDTPSNSQEKKSEEKNSEELSEERPFIKGVRFHAYPYFGYYVGESMGIGVTWSFGVRIFDYGYVGLRTGINWDFPYSDLLVPIQLNLRGYIPINRYVQPYFEISPGLEISCYYGYLSFASHLGAGFDISHFSFGLGYYYGHSGHNFFFRVGVKIGKKS